MDTNDEKPVGLSKAVWEARRTLADPAADPAAKRHAQDVLDLSAELARVRRPDGPAQGERGEPT